MTQKIELKTNVKCGACVSAITPAMNDLNAKHWEVDLKSPDRILTVEGETGVAEIMAALEKSGYKGESI
ncbi:heavy metal transport/detoxification protein [uncultured Cyclobacterium sp.]|uniref:heavy-metal-associated domain-containing protein n=1 Tax=uncultured Cyclobacterium sp. TaxID=453820 RepID=UPI0030ECD5D2|tara:strand:+ start:112631 stop:112837 length:207 start_codon:yes stop_codon:yes gene_type:complete